MLEICTCPTFICHIIVRIHDAFWLMSFDRYDSQIIVLITKYRRFAGRILSIVRRLK